MGIYEESDGVRILIDLDGTLLDARARLHGVFCKLVPNCGLGEEGYWALKRAKRGHAQILRERLGYSPAQISLFDAAWLAEIEQQEWLDKDVPFEGVTAHLGELAERSELYLLTARQRPEMVKYQLEKMGWVQSFRKIFVTGGTRDKHEALEGLVLHSGDWLIGDTGYDVQVGKKIGVRTAAVTSGFLSRESLIEYSADVMVEGFVDFQPW
jgi:phosphoglycolate phosphatase